MSRTRLYRNGVLVTTESNTAGGTVTIPDNGSLPDGSYVYTVEQIDLAARVVQRGPGVDEREPSRRLRSWH